MIIIPFYIMNINTFYNLKSIYIHNKLFLILYNSIKIKKI